MELRLLLPPTWYIKDSPQETAGYPGFEITETILYDEPGVIKEFINKDYAWMFGLIDYDAKGISLERYPSDLRTEIFDFSKRSGAKLVDGEWIPVEQFSVSIDEGKIVDEAIGSYRGKSQSFRIRSTEEGAVPLLGKIFSAPLNDGTDNRFTIVFASALSRRSKTEPILRNIVKSMNPIITRSS